ncbi:hypothetical protein [Shewanella sp.]|nr:hypothetical protein [Shewanella sp.]NRB25996.1 hypothetical protein [Shewanella sp.]
MKRGEIIEFELGVRCPHCEEISAVWQDELRAKEAQCKHCSESFLVEID